MGKLTYSMVRIAIIGFGYWGPNLLRNFLLSEGCTVVSVCDINVRRLKFIKKHNPEIEVTTSFPSIVKDFSIDAIVISTPPHTHFDLAYKALFAGKDVLVEKPMATTTREASVLVEYAEKKKRILMVDHTFVYSNPVEEIKKIIQKGRLGRIVNIDSIRINLGLYQQDVNVVQDLAVHDFTILDYILESFPESISVVGARHFDKNQEDHAYIHLWYPDNVFVNINVSWLSPIKMRRMLLCGTKRMLVYDDMETSEKIKVYNSGIKVVRDKQEIFQMKVGYRRGNIFSPNVEIRESLSSVASDFLNSIRTRKTPKCDGQAGLRLVKIVEMAMKSLSDRGKTLRFA